MRRGKGLQKRSKFVQKAIQNPQKAAEELKSLADGLENCRTTSDIVFALTEILCVSERTIFNDLL